MKLDNRTTALIGVGASFAANCQPCLQTAMTMALASGADEEEIADAIQIGKMVRRGAASKMDKFAAAANDVVASSTHAAGNGCECT